MGQIRYRNPSRLLRHLIGSKQPDGSVVNLNSLRMLPATRIKRPQRE